MPKGVQDGQLSLAALVFQPFKAASGGLVKPKCSSKIPQVVAFTNKVRVAKPPTKKTSQKPSELELQDLFIIYSSFMELIMHGRSLTCSIFH